MITIVRPRYWLTGCLFVWSLFVLFLYKCNHAYEFYILRFFIGLFESAAWPGVMFCLGSWYRKSELARRSGLFVMSGVLGQMFSGYLQSALFARVHGKGGMSAWRWLFIFDFILGVPVAIYGIVSSLVLTIRKSAADCSDLLPGYATHDSSILAHGMGERALPAAHRRRGPQACWQDELVRYPPRLWVLAGVRLHSWLCILDPYMRLLRDPILYIVPQVDRVVQRPRDQQHSY